MHSAPRPDGHHGDRGAVAIIVAIGLVGLIGFAAYVIDVGAMFDERRDLQNGADAAALALAHDCATNGGCSGVATGAQVALADSVAGSNGNDGEALVEAGDISFGSNWVQVTARTWDDSDGNGEIDLALAPVLGQDSKAVEARARAQWVIPGGTLTTIPITFSSCEWAEAMGIPDPINNPPTAADFPSPYRIIYMHDLNPAGNEPIGANGSTPPFCQFGPGQDIDPNNDRAEGGFGFLEASNCEATVSVGGFVQGNPGSGNPNHAGCTPGDILTSPPTTLLIPIFDDVMFDGTACGAPPGQNCYHIFGFAAFEVHDMDLNGNGWSNLGNICLPQQRCLGGYFTAFVTLEEYLASGPPSPPPLGVYTVSLTAAG